MSRQAEEIERLPALKFRDAHSSHRAGRCTPLCIAACHSGAALDLETPRRVQQPKTLIASRSGIPLRPQMQHEPQPAIRPIPPTLSSQL